MELGPDVGHYIRTFFRARARVFPPPRLIPMPSEESQEGLFDSLDPELLETEEFNAAINGGVLSPGPYADQDRKLAEVRILPGAVIYFDRRTDYAERFSSEHISHSQAR